VIWDFFHWEQDIQAFFAVFELGPAARREHARHREPCPKTSERGLKVARRSLLSPARLVISSP